MRVLSSLSTSTTCWNSVKEHPRPMLHRYCELPFQSKGGFRSLSNSRIKGRQWIIIRHGETDWNLNKRVQGRTNVELNSTGQEQAYYTAKALAKEFRHRDSIGCEKSVRIFSSPLSRAYNTATAIAEELSPLLTSLPASNGSIPVIPVDALKEWDLGCLEGLTQKEAVIDFPDDWKIFREWSNPLVSENITNIPIQNGESMEEVRSRVTQCLQEISCTDEEDFNPNETLIAVTHGGVLGQLLRHVVSAQHQDKHGENILSIQKQTRSTDDYHKPKNACITNVTIDVPTSFWVIESWANTEHLSGTSVEPIDTNYHRLK